MSDEVRLFDGEDPAMNLAFETARSTFKYYWREMSWERRRIIPGLILSSVKMCCWDPPEQAKQHGRGAEHMWLSDVGYDGKNISGTLLNQPGWLVTYTEGQEISLPFDQLSDWMYVYAGGDVHGAHTVQLLRSHMGKAERKQHDAAWGLEFGDPSRVKLIPDDWNPAAPKKKGFFGWLFGSLFGGSGPVASDVDLQSIEHPMSLNMLESFEEFLSNTPEAIATTDEIGWTMLHQLAAAGSTSGVKALLKRGADRNAKANNGMTPLQVAQTLDWRDVVKLLG